MVKTAYEKPVRQKHLALPAYEKDYRKIRKVPVGERVKLTRRVLMFNPTHWELYDIEGIIIEHAPNALILLENKTIPYYVIHNWEIIND